MERKKDEDDRREEGKKQERSELRGRERDETGK